MTIKFYVAATFLVIVFFFSASSFGKEKGTKIADTIDGLISKKISKLK